MFLALLYVSSPQDGGSNLVGAVMGFNDPLFFAGGTDNQVRPNVTQLTSLIMWHCDITTWYAVRCACLLTARH